MASYSLFGQGPSSPIPGTEVARVPPANVAVAPSGAMVPAGGGIPLPASAAAGAAASPGLAALLLQGLGPAGLAAFVDRYTTRDPGSVIPDPGEVLARLLGQRAQTAPEAPLPFKYADRPIGTEYVNPQEGRATREDASGRLGGFAPTPRAQIARPVQAPTPVASQDFMDMLARAAAMRGRERESYGTETAPPLPSAPRREYEPGMRG